MPVGGVLGFTSRALVGLNGRCARAMRSRYGRSAHGFDMRNFERLKIVLSLYRTSATFSPL